MKFTRLIALLACVTLAASAMAQNPIANSSPGSNLSFVGGKFVATNYANWGAVAQVYSGNASTGSSSITVRGGYIVLQDGRQIVPFAVGVPFIISDGTPELVTPTSVSGCYKSQGMNQDGVLVTCTVTASFTYIHGAYAGLTSGTNGMAEAVNDAYNWGGGVVVLPAGFNIGFPTSCTNCYASVDVAVAALLPYNGVSIEDNRKGAPAYWNVTPSASTFLAVPATLTATTAAPTSTPTGGYGTGTYHLCIAYVDIMGNEGACSLDFSEAGVATGSFTFTAPAASAGAVGYRIYISLTGGTYALAYQVPLTSAVCTLTPIETVTAACAVTNATYGQTGSGAVVTAITTNTAPIALQLGTISTTSDYVGNSNARTSYAYVKGNRIGTEGLQGSSLPFTACPASVATTVPCVIGTLTFPTGFMNYVGKTVQICGKEKLTGASATVEQIQLWWDGAGSNTVGVPVEIANLAATVGPNTAATYTGNFCIDLFTTAAGTSVTAGSIEGGFSYWNEYLSATPAAIFVGGDTFTATTASLNLAGGAGFTSRLHVVQLHTTGTDVSPQLLSLTATILN